MTTSNTELAAQARSLALRHRAIAAVIRETKTTAISRRKAELAEKSAEVLSQLADAVESKAEPVAYTVAGPVTNWARDFSAYRTQHYVRPVYAAPVQPEKDERKPWVDLTDEQIDDWWRSENGLEDAVMCKLADFRKAVRAVEARLGIGSSTEGGGE